MLQSAQSAEAKAIAQKHLYDHAGVEASSDFQALIWVDENNQIKWVIGYNAFIGKTCQMHVVNLTESYTPKGVLFGAFDFPFNHMNLDKVFAIVNSKNTRAMQYDQKLGFIEAIRFPGMHCNGGDLVVFEMNKADCRWIKERKK